MSLRPASRSLLFGTASLASTKDRATRFKRGEYDLPWRFKHGPFQVWLKIPRMHHLPSIHMSKGFWKTHHGFLEEPCFTNPQSSRGEPERDEEFQHPKPDQFFNRISIPLFEYIIVFSSRARR
jgi:hypothetical protein